MATRDSNTLRYYTISTTIPDKLYSELKDAAEQRRMSLSSLVRFSLMDEDLESHIRHISAKPSGEPQQDRQTRKKIVAKLPESVMEEINRITESMAMSRSAVLRHLLSDENFLKRVGKSGKPRLSDDQARRRRETPSQIPPAVPAQTRSAHFTIRDGLVTTVPTQEIGPDENDYRRLAALQVALLQASKTSQAELSKDNKPFAALLDITDKYIGELDKEVKEINYAVLYAYGLQLAVAYESAQDLIKKGELPDFNLDALTSTKSILELHGPFILSSKDGRDLVTDAERYQRNPTEERQFQADVEQFGDILRERDDLVEEKASEFISDITAPDDGSRQFERRYIFTKGAAKNLVIVFSAGALVASTALIPIVGPVVAASLGLLTVEAMKKSTPFNELSAPIKKGLDDLSDVDLERLRQIPREQLEKMREFVIKHQDILRRVGGSAREMQWFRDVLKWINSSGEIDDENDNELKTKSPGASRVTSKSPSHLVLLLDDSGSMAGQSSANLNEAIKELIDALFTASMGQKPYFRISIISFGTGVKTLAEAEPETQIDLDRVTTFGGDSGSTNATEALNEAVRILKSSPGKDTDFPAYVLLLSDGHPDDPKSARVAAQHLKALDLPPGSPRLVCLGLGGADDDFMREIASSPQLYKKLRTSRDIVTLLPAIGTIGTQSGRAEDVEEAIIRL